MPPQLCYFMTYIYLLMVSLTVLNRNKESKGVFEVWLPLILQEYT